MRNNVEIQPQRGYFFETPIADLNFEELYPDLLKDVRDRLVPHNMVIDIDNQHTPDEDCIIIQWTDDTGEHKYRYLKPGKMNQFEALQKLNKERRAAKASLHW